SERDMIVRYPTYNCGTPNADDCVRVLERADGARRELPTTIFGRCFASGSSVNSISNTPNPPPVVAGGQPPCSDGTTRGERDRDYLTHGTNIASILAGARLDAPPSLVGTPQGAAYNHGVAWEADLLVYVLRASQRDGDARDLDEFDGSFQRAFAFHNARSAVVSISLYPTQPFNDPDGVRVLSNSGMLEILGQPRVPPWERTIYVFAAGNCPFCRGDYSPLLWGALPAKFPNALRGHYQDEDKNNHILSVVNVGADGVIADGSRGCHEAREFCLAAPGESVWVTQPTRYFAGIDEPQATLISVSGTSFAAPHVAGGLAALISYFNGQLGRDELVARVLATANKNGIYADEEVYGQGLLDLAAAAGPVGQLNLPTTQSVQGQSHSARGSVLLVGSAYGDAVERALGERWLVALDELAAPFALPLAGFVQAADVTAGFADAWAHWSRPLQERHHVSKTGARLSLVQEAETGAVQRSASYQLSVPFGDGVLLSGYGVHAGAGFAPDVGEALPPHASELFLAPWLGFGREAHVGAVWKRWQAVAFRSESARDHATEAGGRFGSSVWGVMGGMRHGQEGDRWQGQWQAGFVQEEGARAASLGAGAFALSGQHGTWFAGGNTRLNLGGGWAALASGYVGWTPPQPFAGSLLQEASGMLASQFALALAGKDIWQRGDGLSFYLAQPLRVERGSAVLALPQARTPTRAVVRAPLRFDLAPSGRTLEWGAHYRHEHQGEAWGLAAALVQEPGHRRSAPLEARLFLQYRISF
ncbi:MAG: S8 family serine peptidase, partial [Hyphomicrobiales bacterium]|nr:S8 family serine peptidase [Hyphomicrobiales bacterium]